MIEQIMKAVRGSRGHDGSRKFDVIGGLREIEYVIAQFETVKAGKNPWLWCSDIQTDED